MKVCIIIPARGGSKGILKKNLQLVNGIPLIARTIKVANKSKLADRVIVSTDDDEIGKISLENNAEVIKRSAELGTDEATSESAVLDVISKLKKQENYVPDITVLLQCTSPFTEPEDIDETITTLIKNDADSALTVTKFHHFIWKNRNHNEIIGVNHDEKKMRERRQDISTQYLEAGSVYVMKTGGFIKNKSRFFGMVTYYKIPQKRVFEIDSKYDLEVANLVSEIIM